MRILIIEDEVKTADYLHQGLTESGYIVDRANDGIDGLHMALQHPYELVILDVNLPGIDGWDLLRRLRERSSARVMMLTGHGRLTDKVRGLDLGADDFMVKPFQFPNCWRGSARCCAATTRHRCRTSCGSPTRSWTPAATGPSAAGCGST